MLSLMTGCVEAKPLKIAIVDSGLDLKDPRFKDVLCKNGHIDFTGSGIQDDDGHGTHVAGIIKQNAGKGNYCFVIYKVFSSKLHGYELHLSFLSGILQTVVEHIPLVNISGGGPFMDETEYLILLAGKQEGTTFIVAAGNNGKCLNKEVTYYPAGYDLSNVWAVGSFAELGSRANYSNYGDRVYFWEMGSDVLSTLPKGKYGYMSGTSMATAIKTGKTIKELLCQPTN